MAYLVSITSRAERDLAHGYREINATDSDAALKWYLGLKAAILRLEGQPYRCPVTRRRDKRSHRLYGRNPHTRRVIYRVLENQKQVQVLHIRRAVLPLPLSVRAFKVFSDASKWKLYRLGRMHKLHSRRASAVLCSMLLAASAPAGSVSSNARAQQADPATPVVVQPGAPGKPSRTLPPSTRATLPQPSQADVEFMQGMIMHHSQAVEMTALISSRTENKDLRSLGARISSSQSDEIKFMQRWLAARREPVSMAMPGTPDKHSPGHPMTRMPGMLTPEQMKVLRNAKGAEFDHLFLTGMIQHHNGALIMVKDLFDTAGAGQVADLFNFATDADNTQRAEIRIMQSMLEKKPFKEKR